MVIFRVSQGFGRTSPPRGWGDFLRATASATANLSWAKILRSLRDEISFANSPHAEARG